MEIRNKFKLCSCVQLYALRAFTHLRCLIIFVENNLLEESASGAAEPG